MKFTAKKIDLDLELTLIDGTTVVLKPKVSTDAKSCMKIIKDWRTIEDNAERLEPDEPDEQTSAGNDAHEQIKKTKKGAIKDGVSCNCSELAVVYDKDKEWFMSNLDIITISEVLRYVAESLAGIEKKLESST